MTNTNYKVKYNQDTKIWEVLDRKTDEVIVQGPSKGGAQRKAKELQE